jgi:hypothetical protein
MRLFRTSAHGALCVMIALQACGDSGSDSNNAAGGDSGAGAADASAGQAGAGAAAGGGSGGSHQDGSAGKGGAGAGAAAGASAGSAGTNPAECQPPCDPAQCQVCVGQTCESRCFGTDVCGAGICADPICDPPCDGNTRICSDSVCKTFAELKNEYIGLHPGQAIIPFPWEPITSIRVLPFQYEVPAAPGNGVFISACRGEFEAASFVLTAQKDLSGIAIDVNDLSDAQGNLIPASAIDVRLVKVWYQGSTNPDWMWYITPDKVLTPELLLKDDTLVRVDYDTQTNYLKGTINDVEQAIDISSPSAAFPSDAQFQDASALLPFSLKANENKQIWITVRVPSTTPAGKYSGNVTISAPSEAPVVMNLNVRVLPFDLEPAPVEYGLYYTSIYWPTRDNDTKEAEYKTLAGMLADLQNMKDHGVLYPTLYQQDDGYVDAVLGVMDSAGLPKDKVYILGSWSGHNAYIGNGSTPEELAAITATVMNWRSITESHGYTTTYFYGIDEGKGDELLAQRPAWQTVHNNGGKMWVSCTIGAADAVGDLLDAPVLYGARSATEIAAEIAKFHGHGQHVLTYGNPQAGIENPVVYRKNYGFALWNAGYDGAMDFAYQFKEGASIWNDYDATPFDGVHTYRDHVFAYPTSNGIVDTVQWEGWREGVDDTRYLATLVKKMGDDALARSVVTDSLSKNESMSTTRKRLIQEMLSH